jgi:GNAT superfamily N-acetyltransferase
VVKFRDDINQDEDVDLSRIESPILKMLYFQYDSIFSGDHDNNDDIHFFDREGRYFFTFTDACCRVYADMNKLDESERASVSTNLSFAAPVLRAIYVLKDFRSRGLQKELLDSIKELSEESGESFIAIADPFKIKNCPYEHTAKEAFSKLIHNGYTRPADWLTSVFRQCRRFRAAGLRNFVFRDARITRPFQHFIYLPESASRGDKIAVRSLMSNHEAFTET